MIRSKSCLSLFILILMVSVLHGTVLAEVHRDVRNAVWGMKISDVVTTESDRPSIRTRENFMGIPIDVLVYDTVEDETRVIYGFRDDVLITVAKEIRTQNPDADYLLLLEKFRSGYRRHSDIQASLDNIRSIMDKYRDREIPSEALAVLENPEAAAGIAVFENDRSVIQIPFINRKQHDVIVIYYVEKNFWAEIIAAENNMQNTAEVP